MHPLLDPTTEFRIPGTPWYLDARLPRAKAIVSHAHSDHLGRHGKVVAHPITCALLAHRLAEPGEPEPLATPTPPAESLQGPIADAAATIPTELVGLPYGESYEDGGIKVELFPAGHVLGSAMPRITTAAGRLLYTGDFRFRETPDAATVPPCQLPPDGADVVLMECTYGLARYRFPARSLVIEQLCDTLSAAFAEGRQPVCLCYSLGKAQEIAHQLLANGFAVTMHGAAFNITDIYNRHAAPGSPIAPVRRYEPGGTNLAGSVLIAPPHIRQSRMITNIKNAHISVITGWAIDPSAKYRYQADAAFPLSDHADFNELNAFVDAMQTRGTREFLLTHGFIREFTSHLRSRNIQAHPARPPAQGALFDM